MLTCHYCTVILSSFFDPLSGVGGGLVDPNPPPLRTALTEGTVETSFINKVLHLVSIYVSKGPFTLGFVNRRFFLESRFRWGGDSPQRNHDSRPLPFFLSLGSGRES